MKRFYLIIISICFFQLSSLIAQVNDDFKIILLSDYAGPDNPDSRFEHFVRSLRKYDVEITLPDDYKAIETNVPSRKEFFHRTDIYGHGLFISNALAVALESSDTNCVSTFPYIPIMDEASAVSCNNQLVYEITSVNRDFDLDVKPLVQVVADADMSKYANADTAAVYDMNFDRMGINFMNRYNHCIGIYLRKHGHPLLALKVFLNDEGYANKDKYIRDLLDNVHYGDNTTPLLEAEKKVNGSDFEFKRPVICSHLGDINTYFDRMRPYWDELRAKWAAEEDSLQRIGK